MMDLQTMREREFKLLKESVQNGKVSGVKATRFLQAAPFNMTGDDAYRTVAGWQLRAGPICSCKRK